MGVSRDTFYRYQELANEGGIEALIEKPMFPCLKNRFNAIVDGLDGLGAKFMEYIRRMKIWGLLLYGKIRYGQH